MFYRTPKQKVMRAIDVGQVDISIIENDGTERSVSYVGKMHEGMLFDAAFVFKGWQKRCGETGTAYVGNSEYIPLCNIKRITKKYSKHIVLYDTLLKLGT